MGTAKSLGRYNRDMRWECMGGITERFMAELEGKRKNDALAVAACLALGKDKKKLADPKVGIKGKINILCPPIVKFDEIDRICRGDHPRA